MSTPLENAELAVVGDRLLRAEGDWATAEDAWATGGHDHRVAGELREHRRDVFARKKVRSSENVPARARK